MTAKWVKYLSNYAKYLSFWDLASVASAYLQHNSKKIKIKV